ncbi:MAG: glycosyltransferase family 4 protein [Caldilineaceae bacterium]|nr:glycosyltransferase family 4 protein [Caldilineaceae bacterium]
MNLLQGLQHIDAENQYYLFIGRDTKHLFNITAPNFHPIYLSLSHDPRWLMRPLYYAWQNSLIAFQLKKYQIDVLHLPNLLPHFVRFVPTVVSILDLTEYKSAKYAPLRQSYRKLLPHVLAKTADRILTISNSSKRDIHEITGMDLDRIDVSYLASMLDETTKSSFSVSELPATVNSDYILCVGSALPHKNMQRVLSAFVNLKHQNAIHHKLVLVGNRKQNAQLLEEAHISHTLSQEIILTGYVSDEELSALYRKATVFVYPSLYEGFGLPILEAMTCGAPVITSNVSSLPEVAGNAAILVDPYSEQEIAQAILTIVHDNSFRQQLITKGIEQAQKFSWEQCAIQTLSTYAKAASSS